jgi:hypothetical protein
MHAVYPVLGLYVPLAQGELNYEIDPATHVYPGAHSFVAI